MKDNKIRFLYMIIVGIFISLLLDFIKIGGQTYHNQLFDFIISILITIAVWEGNLRLDHWMNIRFPWVLKPIKRVAFHLPTSIFYSAFVIYLSMLAFNKYVCPLPEDTKESFMITSLVIGVLISIILLTVEISTQFFKQWKSSLVEIEKYKSESLQAQLQNLKNQLNPHFLFNNMSVLSSLVYKDQDKAVDFINQLSKVYRYLLDNRNNELVTLKTELNFIESYNFLLKIRFDKNIRFDVNIPEHYLSWYLPPMSLQMLIENTIKHNEVSAELPLTVSININHDMLQVSNNLQLRTMNEISSKTGIQNIRERYKYFTEKNVEVIETSNEFIVRIPLLDQK